MPLVPWSQPGLSKHRCCSQRRVEVYPSASRATARTVRADAAPLLTIHCAAWVVAGFRAGAFPH